MSLRGYKKKGKPALWVAMRNANVVDAKDAGLMFGVSLSPVALKLTVASRRVRPVSKRRQNTGAEYRRKAEAFTLAEREAGKTCPVVAAFDTLPKEAQAVLTVPWTGNRRSDRITEVHHKRGRAGALLLDERWWLGVSKFGHRAIHMFPRLARERGWLCAVGEWNKTEREV